MSLTQAGKNDGRKLLIVIQGPDQLVINRRSNIFWQFIACLVGTRFIASASRLTMTAFLCLSSSLDKDQIYRVRFAVDYDYSSDLPAFSSLPRLVFS
jgi:hypothetical protein